MGSKTRVGAATAFTGAERRVIGRCRTPAAVQQYLNGLPYNTEPPPGGATLRSFRGVVRHGTAHCMEAALAAAVILEQHGMLRGENGGERWLIQRGGHQNAHDAAQARILSISQNRCWF